MLPREVLGASRQVLEQSFQAAIENLIPHAIEALFAKASSSSSAVEQATVFQTRYYLQEKRQAILEKMQFFLRMLLDRGLETSYAHFRPASNILTQQADSLSLLDSMRFEETLRFNSITTLLRNQADQQLNELNLRISTLFGQEDIRERENPFRPYIFARCIEQAIESMRFEADIANLMVIYLSEALGRSISDIYQQVNADLARQGVEAKLIVKVKHNTDVSNTTTGKFGHSAFANSTSHYGRAAVVAAASGFPAMSMSSVPSLKDFISLQRGRAACAELNQDGQLNDSEFSWKSDKFALGDVLRRIFGKDDGRFPEGSGYTQFLNQTATNVKTQDLSFPAALLPLLKELQSEAASSGMLASERFASQSVLLKLLGKMHKQWVTEQTGLLNARGDLRNLLVEQRQNLRALTDKPEQQMLIDVISMLFESVFADTLITAELKQSFARLQFLYLQLALMDSSFVLAPRHPARLLLSRISSVMLAVTAHRATEREFEAEIAKIFKTLARHDCEVPGLFERIHTRFDIYVEKELRVQDKAIRRAVKSVEEAQLRYQEQSRLSLLISRPLADIPLAQQFKNFLELEWARAILLAARQSESQMQRFCAFVPDVIWSIQPKPSIEDRLLLTDKLPELKSCLQQGLDLLNWNNFKQNALYGWLNDAHQKALNTVTTGGTVLSQVELQNRFALLLRHIPLLCSEGDLSGEYTAIRPFLSAVTAEIDLAVHYLESEAYNTDAAAIPIALKPGKSFDSKAILDKLIAGTPLEIQYEGNARRACVHWSDPHACVLILSVSGVSEPVIAEQKYLLQQFSRSQAKLIEPGPAFERAITTMIRTADHLESQGQGNYPG
ncbi:DUF1631 family protein [Undibacterium rugosum]|uniref:DUF1631 family protein n=1 Tax=Undibacterium rugosum TaxID=2762291 RepID=UPI001B835B6E|nr:DUF1631 family protein [Undibacterium rugosum]MBR7780178.1 DUF1631 family protein [Undibacterium rugosum]